MSADTTPRADARRGNPYYAELCAHGEEKQL